MEYKSVFYPTEMDLYDALFSNSQKITSNVLLEMARGRGIFLSEHDDREYLCRYISLLDHDYFQFKEVSNQIARVGRIDKTASLAVGKPVPREIVTAALKDVQGARSKSQENLTIVQIDETTTRLSVSYEEIDHSRSRMIQKVTNEGYVDIIATSKGTTVRYSANLRIDAIKNQIMGAIASSVDGGVEPLEISFFGITDTSLRTRFFTRLIGQIRGHEMKDVCKVRLSSKLVQRQTDDDEREGLEDQIVGFIKSASFDGESLLSSAEYQQLEAKGYFITSIRWTSIENGTNPNIVEMEALFDNPEDGTGFRYAVRGIYRHMKRGYTQLRPAKEGEEKDLLSRIESASNQIFSLILDELKPKGGENEPETLPV